MGQHWPCRLYVRVRGRNISRNVYTVRFMVVVVGDGVLFSPCVIRLGGTGGTQQANRVRGPFEGFSPEEKSSKFGTSVLVVVLDCRNAGTKTPPIERVFRRFTLATCTVFG